MIGAAGKNNRKTKTNIDIKVIIIYQNIVFIARAIAIIRSIACSFIQKNELGVLSLSILPQKHAK